MNLNKMNKNSEQKVMELLKQLGFTTKMICLGVALPWMGMAEESPAESFINTSERTEDVSQASPHETSDASQGVIRCEGSKPITITIQQQEPTCCAEPKVVARNPSCPRSDCFSPKHIGLVGEFLYWIASADGIRYATKTDGTANNPVVKAIGPSWTFDPGVRLAFDWGMGSEWEGNLIWTYFRATPPSVSAYNPSDSIYASMNMPVWNSTGNPSCQFVQGKWSFKCNLGDFELKKPVCICDSVMIKPFLGAKGGVIREDMRVQFAHFPAIPNTYPQQQYDWRNKIWAVGPTIGCESKLFIPGVMSLFVRGASSVLAGMRDAVGIYSNFTGAPADLTQSVSSKEWSLISFWQMQAAFSKRWEFDACNMEILLGWETQVWNGITGWEAMSTIVTPPANNPLYLFGPFFRADFEF